jgi:CheY-specific phosphatase CheX
MNDAALQSSTLSKGPVHDAIAEVVAESVAELLQHYGLSVLAVDIVAEPIGIHGHQVAGIIGFAGAGVSGTLAVRAGSSAVRACLPVAPLARNDTQVLGDWIAELSNQLLGRSKNKLLRFGVTFHITPPTFAAADELLVVGHDPVRTSWLSVTTSVGLLAVMLELHTASNFQLVLDEQDSAIAHAEGECVLF